MPCSNECPSALALELCETAEEAVTPPGRVSGRGAENPCRSSRSQAQRTDNEAASRCPLASTRRRGSHATRARLPAPPTAALRSAGAAPHWFLACGPARTAAAQPHAREHHAQHIMNQARAHQKACGCSVSSQSRRARSAERHAVEQYITSHRWRAGLDNVAEWRRVAGAGPTHERNKRRRTKQQREWQRRKHEEGKNDQGRQLKGPAPS